MSELKKEFQNLKRFAEKLNPDTAAEKELGDAMHKCKKIKNELISNQISADFERRRETYEDALRNIYVYSQLFKKSWYVLVATSVTCKGDLIDNCCAGVSFRSDSDNTMIIAHDDDEIAIESRVEVQWCQKQHQVVLHGHQTDKEIVLTGIDMRDGHGIINTTDCSLVYDVSEFEKMAKEAMKDDKFAITYPFDCYLI